MRIFQFVKQVPANTRRFEEKYKEVLDGLSYDELRELYLKDGFYTTHILKPILEFDWDNIGYAVWDYERLQKKWAEEQGFQYKTMKDILWAQIEAFKPDVIYNLHPIYFTKEEIANLPTNPKKVCWFAAPANERLDFSAYALRLTNLPLDLTNNPEDQHINQYFYPAVTSSMWSLSQNTDRPIDVLFYGQYVKDFFSKRNALMDRLMAYKLETKHDVRLHLMCQVIQKPVVNIPLVRRYFKKTLFPPAAIWKNKDEPLFGDDLYRTIAQSKIVVNAAVDFSGQYKVNMRNFETTGCGTMLLTDQGIYPEGFVEGEHYASYRNYEELIEKLEHYLADETARKTIADQGHAMVHDRYSKDRQWKDFIRLCETIL